MPRLTAELIQTSPQFVNPLKQRELDLRGNKISAIENLGSTEDQFEVIDLSDNEITKLENFPPMRRLTAVFASNNRIAAIAEGLGQKLPNVDTLILANNKFEKLSDLDQLGDFPQLAMLCLLKNTVISQSNYRWYVISKIPTLKVLDFKKITAQERTAAFAYWSNGEGKRVQTDFAKANLATQTSGPLGLTPEEKQHIMGMIQKAGSNEEVSRLAQVLQSGKKPKEKPDASDAMDLEEPKQ